MLIHKMHPRMLWGNNRAILIAILPHNDVEAEVLADLEITVCNKQCTMSIPVTDDGVRLEGFSRLAAQPAPDVPGQIVMEFDDGQGNTD